MDLNVDEVRARGGPTVPSPADAYQAFVQEVSPALLQVAIAVTLDRDAAADALQETLLEAFKRWDRVGTLDRPDLWARRVLVNRAIDWRRSQRRRLMVFDRLSMSTSVVEELGDTVAFWQAARALPRQQSIAVFLRTAGELSVDEIAEVMDIAPGTVRATLHSSRSSLRVLLAIDAEPEPKDIHGGGEK